MNIQPINKNIKSVKQAINELSENADNISGMLVLVCLDNDENYDYYVAGIIGAERMLGRIEIVKRSILDKVQF